MITKLENQQEIELVDIQNSFPGKFIITELKKRQPEYENETGIALYTGDTYREAVEFSGTLQSSNLMTLHGLAEGPVLGGFCALFKND